MTVNYVANEFNTVVHTWGKKRINIIHQGGQTCLTYRGYYMAARRYEFYLIFEWLNWGYVTRILLFSVNSELKSLLSASIHTQNAPVKL